VAIWLVWSERLARRLTGTAVTDYQSSARTEASRFRGTLDDAIIIPLVLVALAVNKVLRFVLLILMRLLDYAFPLAIQIIWLPLLELGLPVTQHFMMRDSPFDCAKKLVRRYGLGQKILHPL